MIAKILLEIMDEKMAAAGSNNWKCNNQIIPFINSTKGYLKDIFPLQLAHSPNWIKYDIKGIFLYIGILCLQCTQNDLGLIIDRLLGNLYIITFKKLPKINPMIKYIIFKKYISLQLQHLLGRLGDR